jgi:F-type H+-transporting ATPase subunit delta
VPLDEEQSSRMRDALARRFDCEIELENEIDEAVIGGAVVYAGDEVIDGSLRGRLQQLSSSLAP